MKARPRNTISSPAQLKVLASPARQEILDLLARLGPASAAELSRYIGRPADGLYYHLRTLQSVDLVRPAAERVRAGRTEALFSSAHRVPTLFHDPSSKGNTPDIAAIVGSMLRLGIRDFRRAAFAGDARTVGSKRELWALRVTGWLSGTDLAVVNRRIRGLRDVVGEPRPKTKLYAVTVLLTPLDHRTRKKQLNPRSSRRER